MLQRRRGHRYSLDDVLTAREAASALPHPQRYLDMGCGIGSVLLMVGYKHPQAEITGIEAQEISFQLCQRNIARNGVEARILHADLRDPEHEELGRFDLISGTPPYKRPGTATPSPDPQRAHARVELRGGIEDYMLAGARLLADDGIMVVCGDSEERARAGARASGLHIYRTVEAIPRADRPVLFSVWCLSRREPESNEREQLIARDAEGARTEDYFALRAFFGLPRTH